MNYAELASDKLDAGYSCSQAVFAAYAETLGLDQNQALKIASGLGGGMGRMALTCGAVTGAFLVIGLKHGSASVDDKEAKAKVYRLVREFTKAFIALNGAIGCRELLGYDISTPDGQQKAQAEQLFKTICPEAVKVAAEILEEMLGLAD